MLNAQMIKSTSLYQALVKADAACLRESQDPRTTQIYEIEQHNNRDVTIKSRFRDINSRISGAQLRGALGV